MSEELNSLESSLSKNIIKRSTKPSYSAIRVKNKGAILILIVSYLVTSVYSYIIDVASKQSNTRAVLAVTGLTLPLAGWLADVRFGRYRVLSGSLWMMWISSLLLTLTLVVADLTNFTHESILVIAFLIPLGIGWGGFQANIIQFGIDQLIDASTRELKSFITWYSWTVTASQLVIYYILTCIKYKFSAPFLICCSLTFALTLKLLFESVLIKEPKTHNPCKLVYQVIKYAIKHKYPRQRSAFTYCEDVIPSRIDFGKSKYGGPFTTEQVEDVKTLFRVISVALIGCIVFSVSDERYFTPSKINSMFKNRPTNQPVAECSSEFIFTGFYFISGTALIPLYELLVYPLFHRCLPDTKSLYKFALGAFLRLGKPVLLLILVTYSRLNYSKNVGFSNNATLPCLFNGPDGFLGAYLDYRWTALPEFLYVASNLIIYIACLEFLCAQVPYSMKGVVLGTTYAFLEVCILFLIAIELLYGKKSLNWGSGVISCGFWFFVTKISLLITATVIFFIVMKYYKKRKREDVLPNEQIFAERYYSS